MYNASTVNQITTQFVQRYRYSFVLLRQLVITDFKLRYQGSVLGYLWSLLKPLMLFSILYVVFVKFLRIGAGLPHYPIYLLLGVVVWYYFVEVTSMSLGAIVGRGDLMRKLNFPRYVIVLSIALSALINLFFNLIVVGAFIIAADIDPRPAALLAPLLILELFVVSTAAGFILSAFYVRFRDLSYIWDVVLQGAFYATPILYPLAAVPTDYAKWLLLNPLAQIIQDLRYALITEQTPTIAQYFSAEWVSLIPITFVVILGIVAAQYFRRRSRSFAEEV